MPKARIKKGDMVVVVSGKDRDRATPRRVLQVMPNREMALVEGASMMKTHARPNPQKNIKGGILEREGPIHLSNLMPLDPETKKPTRVGSKLLADGRRVRFARGSGAQLDK